MAIYEKLLAVQSGLKAPKGQYNSFGKYKYRSCEDILEAVKPLLKQNGVTLVIGDSIEMIGERYYVKATARLIDITDGTTIENTAYAREENEKKGMDGSQITGTASSYARKYCLNGLFDIDDTKDADTDEYQQQGSTAQVKQQTPKQEAKAWIFDGKYYKARSKDGHYISLTAMTAQQLDWVMRNPEFPKEMHEQAEKVLTTGAA